MADPVTQIETAPLFKGATRPACILGVPTETFVITVLTGMVISLLFWPPLMLLIPIPVWIFKLTNEENGMYDSNSRSFSKIFNLSKITCDP